uniref:Zona pellucida sperm-binding protein 4 n=1 Tax=Naja naja TaxID=35670 RepID=A0A8C6VFS5_NAJNA
MAQTGQLPRGIVVPPLGFSLGLLCPGAHGENCPQLPCSVQPGILLGFEQGRLGAWGNLRRSPLLSAAAQGSWDGGPKQHSLPKGVQPTERALGSAGEGYQRAPGNHQAWGAKGGGFGLPQPSWANSQPNWVGDPQGPILSLASAGRGPQGGLPERLWVCCGCPIAALSPPVLDPPSPSRCSVVQLAERLPCSSHRVSHGQCSHLGCCFDPQDRVTPCYYGKTVTARCTPDGSFSLAVSRDAAVPPLSLDSLHLLSRRGGACGPLSRNEAFVVFNFPLSACGTIFKVSGEAAAQQQPCEGGQGEAGWWRPPSLSRGLTASPGGQGDWVSVLLAAPPPLAAVAQQGPLALDMRVAGDESYSSFYGPLDFPVVKLLREPVPLEVRLLGRRDPALHLLLHKCWAAPSADPLRAPQWPLLQDRCPYQGDSYQAQLVPLQWDSGLPFPSHHQRFVVRTFSLVDTDARQMLSGLIYFHCSASACLPSTQEPCGTRCEASLQGRRELVLCCRGSLSGGWGLWGSHCGSRTHTHTPSSPLQAREMPGEELRWRQGRCY